MRQAVCVAGAGCICAAGDNLEQAVDSMLAGERHVSAEPPVDVSHPQLYPVFAVSTQLDNYSFSAEDSVYLRTAILGLNAAQQALDHAGCRVEQLRKLRVGVCIGTTIGSSMDVEGFYREYRNGAQAPMRPINCFLNDNPAIVISRHYGFNGPCQTVVNACSSGTDAIGIAAMWLRNGLCDVVLAGGADELCRTTYNGFASLQISSPQLCTPFSSERGGLNLGEGAAVLVLTRSDVISDIQQQAAYGHILGYGSGSDGWHLTAPHPQGRGLIQAVNECLSEAGANAAMSEDAVVERMAFVNTHGTGTRDNDRVEGLVLKQHLSAVPFHSTKGYTGHTLGAAGAIETAFTLAFLRRNLIPASAGFVSEDSEIGVSPVVENTAISSDIALSESLAFGGNNAALIVAAATAVTGVKP